MSFSRVKGAAVGSKMTLQYAVVCSQRERVHCACRAWQRVTAPKRGIGFPLGVGAAPAAPRASRAAETAGRWDGDTGGRVGEDWRMASTARWTGGVRGAVREGWSLGTGGCGGRLGGGGSGGMAMRFW